MHLREVRCVKQHVTTFSYSEVKSRIVDALAHPDIKHRTREFDDKGPHFRTTIHRSQHQAIQTYVTRCDDVFYRGASFIDEGRLPPRIGNLSRRIAEPDVTSTIVVCVMNECLIVVIQIQIIVSLVSRVYKDRSTALRGVLPGLAEG